MAFADTVHGRVATGTTITSAPARSGLFKRTVDALIESRRRQAEIEVARVLGNAQLREMRPATVSVAPSRTGGPIRRAVEGLRDVFAQAQALRRDMHTRYPMIEG